MTAISVPFQTPRHNNLGVFLFLFLVLAAVTYEVSAHALRQHPTEAESVAQCLTDKGAMYQAMNPLTGRIAHVCQLNDGKFGIYIEGVEDETGNNCVSCFLRAQAKKLQDVIDYLANRGYTNPPPN